MRRTHRYLFIALGVGAALVAIRLALPYVVKDYVNRQLDSLAAYRGRIEDVDLALWRGAYELEGVQIAKRSATRQETFFTSDRIALSIEWGSLFGGSIVGEGTFIHPTLNLVQSNDKNQAQLGKDENWAKPLEALFPFRFNTVEVRDGTVTFKVPGIQTPDALTATHVEGELSNLTNVVDKQKEAFADFTVTAEVLETGHARIAGSIDPLAASPTFDVNLTVERVKLPEVNPWLRQYLKADAASGDFELYLEMAAAKGRFKGYAKPLMKDVNLHGSEDDNKPALRKLWEGAVNFAAKVLENKEKSQVAARIPFSGTIANPKAGILETIASVLQNAFIGAFANSLEDSISIRDVEKGLKKYAADDGKSDRDKK